MATHNEIKQPTPSSALFIGGTGSGEYDQTQANFSQVPVIQNKGPSEGEMSPMTDIPAYGVGYDKDAISRFKKQNYVAGLNGHYEFQSANTLRNSVKMAINFDSSFDRFKASPRGGHFATSCWNKSTFEKKKIHFPVEPAKEDLPKGRPLFVREINKAVPPPDSYNIKRNIEIEKINPKRPCLFGHSYESYRKTCDIQKGVKVFDFASNHTNTSHYLPNLDYARRHFPAFKSSKAKQFALWDAEEKQGGKTPAPNSYNQDDKAVKMLRFDGVSFGFDVKSNQKEIVLTPGPGDYVPDIMNSLSRKSHNFKLNHGGVDPPRHFKHPKEQLVKGSYAPPPLDGTIERTRDTSVRASQKTTTPRTDIIQHNKLAVKNAGLNILMNSTLANSSDQMEKLGGKAGIEAMSDSLANSMTNFSHRDNQSFMHASHLPQFSQIPKLVNQAFGSAQLKKKHRFHQSFFDDSRVSPRHQLPDFAGTRKRRNDILGGYETEVTAGQDNRQFNMTYDDGFTNVFDSNEGAQSIQPKKGARDLEMGGSHMKKVFLKKQTLNHSEKPKAKSSSNVHRYFTQGKAGHKCYI